MAAIPVVASLVPRNFVRRNEILRISQTIDNRDYDYLELHNCTIFRSDDFVDGPTLFIDGNLENYAVTDNVFINHRVQPGRDDD